MTILITESEDYSSKAISVYRSLGRVYFLSALRERQRKAVERATTVLVVGLQYQITRDWIERMPNLKVVATNATGLNHIDIVCLKEKGIKLISLRGRTGFLKK